MRGERSTSTAVLTYTSKPVKKRDNFSVHHAKRNASVIICDDESEVNNAVFFDDEDDVLSLLNKILMCKEKIHLPRNISCVCWNMKSWLYRKDEEKFLTSKLISQS